MNTEIRQRRRGWIGLFVLASVATIAPTASAQLLYSIDQTANTLNLIDPSNGTVSTVGPIGHQFFGADLTFSRNSIYAITANSAGVFGDPGWTLVEIDPQTGAKLRSVPALLSNGQRPRLIEGIATIDDRLVLAMNTSSTTSPQLADINPNTGVITNIVDHTQLPGCDSFVPEEFGPDFDGLGADPNGAILAAATNQRHGALVRVSENARSCTIIGEFDDPAGVDDVASVGELTFGIGRRTLYQFDLSGLPLVARTLIYGPEYVILTGLAAAPAVGVTFVDTGTDWRYLDDGSDQGIAWRNPSFDDSAWASGPSELGYGDGDEATVIGCTSEGAPCVDTGQEKFITTYFRTEFYVDNPAIVASLSLEMIRDDGAAVYLNGIEIARELLVSDASFNTFADAAVGTGGETHVLTFAVDPSLLVAGRNVLSAEVHQAYLTSSDVSFDVRLRGQVVPVPEPPGWLPATTLVAAAIVACRMRHFRSTPTTAGLRCVRSTGHLRSSSIGETKCARFTVREIWLNCPSPFHAKRHTLVSASEMRNHVEFL